MMRPIHTLVWHCTATPEGKEFTVGQIDAMHRARGFKKIGYHKLVHLDGSESEGRPESEVGAHVKNHNTGTLGYSYVGGVEKDGYTPKDTRTPEQKATMIRLTKEAVTKYKLRAVLGHRDLSPDKNMDGKIDRYEWIKACPCFDAIPEYEHLLWPMHASGIHTVAKGETLSAIARRYGASIEEILSENEQIEDAHDIRAGQQITIPRPGAA